MAIFTSKYTGPEIESLLDKVNNNDIITVDNRLSSTSINPVQNKVVKAALDEKQDMLESGYNIKTINGKSILGYGNIEIQGGAGGEGVSESEVNDLIEEKLSAKNYATKSEVNVGLKGKQDAISDLATIRSGAAKGATALQQHQDISHLATKIEVKAVNDKVTQLETNIESISPTPMVSVTYAELKTLRDNGELIAGMQYRITDYVTTTTQANTRSAGHQFDVIVVADSSHTLNEKARACLHDGDTYFSDKGAKLEAWQIWYCLDNDKTRFGWAIDFAFLRMGQVFTWNGKDNDNSGSLMYEWEAPDGTIVYTKTLTPQVGESTYDDVGDEDGIVENIINGKGVIYRMIDEWNNDCPYDFKNIQFKRWEVTQYDKTPALVVDNDENYCGYYYGALDIEGGQSIAGATYGSKSEWFYTFALQDLASKSWYDYTIANGIGLRTDENKIIICSGNTIKECRDEYIGEYGMKTSMLNNIVIFNCHSDIASPDYADEYSKCYDNSFDYNCHSSSFGDNFQSNSFGEYCFRNSFADECTNNSFGNNCNSNSFGYACGNNSFGNACYNNSFGNNCTGNSFGNSCDNNSFGSNCSGNFFRYDCSTISLGDRCYNNSFGNHCYDITFTDSFGIANNVSYNKIDDNVYSIELYHDNEPGDYTKLSNHHICSGVHSRAIEIYDNRKYITTYAMTSGNELREFVIADLKAS